MPEAELSPAEKASERALREMRACLEEGESFRLEAGAGAGKTYSLVRALRWLIQNQQAAFSRKQQHVACITYTNVAKSEIEERIDGNPLIHVSTIHSFCWSLIAGYQRQLRAMLPGLEVWSEKLEEAEGIQQRRVDYNLGFRFITDDTVSLHHDDVIPLTIRFMENAKFRTLLCALYPVILIDEYQDTDAQWVAAIKEHFLGKDVSPQFGFFGDFWQKIYDTGCGELDHPAIKIIGKEANFRSTNTVIDALNKMRPELPQFPEDENSVGEITAFHTNSWTGDRRGGQGGGHWKGDLPAEMAKQAYNTVVDTLKQDGWDFESDDTKILMLTHRVLATEQGYEKIVQSFRYRDDFLVPDHPHLKFFHERLEPARQAFHDKRFGEMMGAFSSRLPVIRGAGDKEKWSQTMAELAQLAETGTVANVIDYMRTTGSPPLPDDLIKLEDKLQAFDANGEEVMDRRLKELEKLREIPYAQVIALSKYLSGYSPFETKHGVKGLEFENVLVVVGRGWNKYNFGDMLAMVTDGVPAGNQAKFERNRNLFYVCCSRAKKRLAILFTQELQPSALTSLETWFSADRVREIEL